MKKSEGRFEWWFTNFESHRDCIEATRHAATTPPQNEWYSEPVGCRHFGNNYWRVRIMNAPYSGDHECIVRCSSAEAARMGISYGPALKGRARPQGDTYCY
jgi:hypothetical protein